MMLVTSHVSMTARLMGTSDMNLITLLELFQLWDFIVEVTFLVVWEVLFMISISHNNIRKTRLTSIAVLTTSQYL